MADAPVQASLEIDEPYAAPVDAVVDNTLHDEYEAFAASAVEEEFEEIDFAPKGDDANSEEEFSEPHAEVELSEQLEESPVEDEDIEFSEEVAQLARRLEGGSADIDFGVAGLEKEGTPSAIPPSAPIDPQDMAPANPQAVAAGAAPVAGRGGLGTLLANMIRRGSAALGEQHTARKAERVAEANQSQLTDAVATLTQTDEAVSASIAAISGSETAAIQRNAEPGVSSQEVMDRMEASPDFGEYVKNITSLETQLDSRNKAVGEVFDAGKEVGKSSEALSDIVAENSGLFDEDEMSPVKGLKDENGEDVESRMSKYIKLMMDAIKSVVNKVTSAFTSEPSQS